MAEPTTPMPISAEAQKGVVSYLNSAQSLYGTSYNIRNQLRQNDLAYYREKDMTEVQLRAKAANQTGDTAKLQNVTVPVVMPQVESQLAALADVFLTGYPIFGTVAPPENADSLEQFDALIADNSSKGGWPSELMVTMRDGLKHDLGAIEVVWQKKNIFAVGTPELAKMQEGSKMEMLYEGNFLRRLDPYNLLLDTRVSPDKNHIDGEFAGYSDCISRIKLKMLMADLAANYPKATMNYREAFESGSSTVTTSAADAGYYIPEINPEALLPVGQRSDHDWLQWANLDKKSRNSIAYHGSYNITVLYARILPSDFGMRVPNPGTVQIWKFIIINSRVVIFAERQTNAHNYLPIIVCKPSNDGMGWQSKSFAVNATPYQDIASSLMNSAMASQRRKVYDRILYDPTKVRKQDIERTDPVARIPVRNTQFGKGFEGAVQSMQYSDTGVAEVIQMSQSVVQMGEVAVGQNRVQQGQFQKGNKTRREFDSVMGNAGNRQKMTAIGLEFTFFTPIKEIIKSNILQYQPPVTITDAKSGKELKIDPSKLRKALISFTLSDGMMTSEKLASLDVANSVVQAATQIPQIQQEYDVMGILNYTWDLQGIHWLGKFKRDATGKAAYLADVAAQTTAQGEMPPPQPQQPGVPDAGAAGAV